jgi:hypothetical protein
VNELSNESAVEVILDAAMGTAVCVGLDRSLNLPPLFLESAKRHIPARMQERDADERRSTAMGQQSGFYTKIYLPAALLPLELEREIFETAAIRDPKVIPTLLQVCHWVHAGKSSH